MKKLALTILCLLLIASTASALEIRLKPRVLVQDAGGWLTLGQIAEGVNDPSLSALALLPAPRAGQKRSVAKKEIRRALERHRPDLRSVEFTGASRVVLVGGGQVVQAPQIERMLHRFLQKNQGRLPKAQLRLTDVQLPDEVVVPHGKLTHQVVPSNPKILGSRRFNVTLRVDGRLVKNLTVRARLEALAPVAVAAADLTRGTMLGPADVQQVVADISALRDPCFTLEDLIGKRLKRSLRTGQTISRKQVDFPPMVRRGQVVEIRVQRGGIMLSAKGEARQNGQQGETIRVRNTASRRELLCRVLAPGLVEVEI